MGNHISCTLANVPNSKSIKVVQPNNEVRRVDGPAKAAELMLETPGHFLVCSSSMQVGKRVTAVSADQELDPNCAYITFPMSRLNSPVGASDMARLLIVANGQLRRSSGGGARVIPESSGARQTDDRVSAKAKLEELLKEELREETEMKAVELGELRQRMSVCRSRRPTLETIQEEIIVSSR